MASPRSKRPREVTKLETVCEEIASATVRGVLVPSLSPIKKARTCKYFEGTMEKLAGALCFSESFHAKFAKVKEERSTIDLEDVKERR